ncbi:MAG TPA: sigma-70 family RNA polymerase sigma factor [Vicinamibacterales bacterium]|nr:sigma-70 family RNA polymerase sigma factor [Vicinamibacterales bacterium]
MTEGARCSDLDLVRRAQDGDTDAFGELIDRHRRAVFRAALAAVRSPADADDVAQEAFVTAYRKLGSFRGDSSFKTWLLTIAWNRALDRRKSVLRWLRQTVTPHEDADGTPRGIEHIASGRLSQEERLAGAEFQQALRRQIAALPRKMRDALLLAGSGEYSYEEIGRMLGCPVGTVKWRVFEARRVLKEKLDRKLRNLP